MSLRWQRNTPCWAWSRASLSFPQASIQQGRLRQGSLAHIAQPDTRRNHNQIHSESDASWSISWCWETRIQEHILHYSSQTPETKLAQITWYIHQNKQKGSYRKTPICMLGFGWLKEVVKHFQYFKYFHKSCEVELSNSPAAFGGSPQHFVQCQGCWWWRVGWCLAYQLWTILSRQFPAFEKPKPCV